MPIIQADREVRVTSPLGTDALLFSRLRGNEELGRLSEFHCEFLSEKFDLKSTDILGKTMTVRLELPSGGGRFFNGYVTRFAHAGGRGNLATYQATLRPWLWFLTRASNSRIYQDKTVIEIIRSIFDEYGGQFEVLTDGTYAPLPYCVQYSESDFDFVSRLMEQAGLYYYFKHTETQHTLVLADSYGAHNPITGYAKVRFAPGGSQTMRDSECVSIWSVGAEIQTGAVSLKDFDFEQASTSTAGGILVRSVLAGNHQAHANHERYGYPGGFIAQSPGEALARTQIESLHAQTERVEAVSNARGLFPGGLFDLIEHPRTDQNKGYLVTSARYQLSYDGYESTANSTASFSCQFQAISKLVTYRSAQTTAKALVQGPQTAMVVGKAGEEIWTDQYGRIKVQFHWDRAGERDEKSSCWVRVAQGMAGKRWGAMFLPRIGQEVIVEFLEGDPDRPIVTGTVYNAGAMPPYELPANATRSTIKTNSSKGGNGFNEIRFEDKKGEEQVFIHAEKNQDIRVKADALEWIGKDRHLIVKGDQFEKVEGAKHGEVIGDHNQKIGGALSVDVTGDWAQKAGTKVGVQAGTDVHIKGGVNVVIEAGVTLTLKAGPSFVVIGPAGVAISGTPIMLNSGGSAGSGAGASPTAPTAPKEADGGA